MDQRRIVHRPAAHGRITEKAIARGTMLGVPAASIDPYGEWKVLDLSFTPQDFAGS
jgi:hypothetical protein